MDDIEYMILKQAIPRDGIATLLAEIDVSKYNPKDVDIALQNLVKERLLIMREDGTVMPTWKAISAVDREELRRNRA